MTRYFYDGEFLEDGKTVMPISIGIVTEGGRELYRVFADWLCDPMQINRVRDHLFLVTQVVPHMPDVVQKIISGERERPTHVDEFRGHPHVVPAWRIRQEVEAFFREDGPNRKDHELWAYYGAYDHVMLAQIFGRMIDLPPSIPMFTRELMQFEGEVNDARSAIGLAPVERPAKGDEHHALADARWDRAMWKALWAGDPRSLPTAARTKLAWTIDEDRDLVTIPSRVFVAGYERLESVGPNEGLDAADEEPARRLWNALL